MSSTELIQNSDGSVYHLALHPHEVSDIIITVGDPDRVGKISERFDEVELKRQAREFVTHTGRLGKQRITVISTGIGTDNVDIVLNELHYLHSQKYQDEESDNAYRIIRLGTSGVIQEDMPIDSILLSEAAIGLDGLLHFYPWQNNLEEIEKMTKADERWRILPRPYGAFASKHLVSYFEDMADSKGVTLTAPGFYAPQGRSVNLPPRVSDFISFLAGSSFAGRPITNIEMETAGIYGLSILLGHQAISLSAILANRATGEFSQNPEQVMERLITKALEVVQRL